MKKIIKILSQLSLVSGGTLSTVACSGNSFGGGVIEPGKPGNSEPEVKDRDYYLKLIAENEANIAECQEWISDIKKEPSDDEVTDKDKKDAIKEINAEINHYQAENDEYHYQILLLRNNGTIDIVDKAEALIYLADKIEKLNKEWKAKQELFQDYPEEYLQDDLDEISNNINNTQVILDNLLQIEEENND